MKKLIVFAAVAVMAVATQAAALNWTISNVYAGNATDKMAGGTAALFATAYSADGITPTPTLTTIAAVTALLDDGKVSDALALAAATKATSAAGGVSGATGLSGFTTGDTFSGFAVILNADQSKYVIAQDASGNQVLNKTWTNATTAQNMAFGSQASTTQDASNWAATSGVPEPTSGLLLLMGVGLLGLRRKQK